MDWEWEWGNEMDSNRILNGTEMNFDSVMWLLRPWRAFVVICLLVGIKCYPELDPCTKDGLCVYWDAGLLGCWTTGLRGGQCGEG